MRKTVISGLLAFIAAAIWHPAATYVWEFGRSIIYEWIWQMIEPYAPAPLLFQYGPSVVLIGVGLYLFWQANGKPRFWESPEAPAKKTYKKAKKQAQKPPIGIVGLGAAALAILVIYLLGNHGEPSRLALDFVNVKTDNPPIKFDYYLKNVGGTSAIAFVHNETSALLDGEPKDEDLDRIFAMLKDSLRVKSWELTNSEVAPGESKYFTFTYVLKKEDWESVEAGPKFLAQEAVLKYRDKTLPSGRFWYTELCFFTMKGQGFHSCKNHDGHTYVE